MAFQNAEAIQKLYVAFFNRPADYYGLQYWDGVIAKSGNADAVIASLAATFAQSKEYTDTYAGQNTRQIINNIYKNLFGRPAEEAGLEYWNAEVTAGRVTLSNAVLMISGGAQNADKIAYASKVTAATSFTNALDTTDERLGYAGEKANAVAKQFIAGVTDAASLATAITPANLDATVNQSIGAGQTATTYALTKGLDNIPGTSGNDVIVGSIDNTAAGVELNTLSSIDIINGGAGVDTLKIAHASSTDGKIALGNLTNVEVVEITSAYTDGGAGLGVDVDATGVAGLTDLNVVRAADAVKATAAATTNVGVSMKDAAAVGSITVIGGKNVNVATTDSVSAINVGAGAAADPAGAVTVSATGAAVVNNTNTAVTATTTMGKIIVGGGTTINVTQKATVGNTAQIADGGKEAVVQGAVEIKANTTTTDVTVKQDATNAGATSRAAVAGATEVATVKFLALKSGESVTVGGLTFKAAKDLTAAEVAQAFANVASSAIKPTQIAPAGAASGDTNGSSVAANGTFSGSLASFATAGDATAIPPVAPTVGNSAWTSGAANGDTVTFTGRANTFQVDLTASSSKAESLPVVTTTTQGVTTVTAQNRLGITAGLVTIEGAAALKNVTVDGYGSVTDTATPPVTTFSSITGGSNAALSTITLANGGSFNVSSAAATLALNLNNVNGTVNVAAGTKTLNATVAGDFVATTLASASATAVNVAGTGNVVGNTATGLTVATSISTSAMTAGSADFTIANGTTTSYTGGAAEDYVTVTNADTAVSKAITLGAGDDWLNLQGSTGNVVVSSVALSGGEGTDIIALNGASAQALSGNGDFAGKIDGFERLEITDVVGAVTTVNMANMDGINYVITNGSSSATASTGNKQEYSFDIAGLQIDNGATLRFGGATLFTASANDTTAAAIATDINGDVVTIAGVKYDVTTTGTVVTLRSQENVAPQASASISTTGTVDTGVASTAVTVIAGAADVVGGVPYLTIDKLAANGTVELVETSAGVIVKMADATGTADTLNIVTTVETTAENFGTVIAAGVETIKINAADAAPTDSSGNATIDTGTLALNADKATSVTISGNSHLNLSLVGDSKSVATIDGSTMTGKLSFAASGAAGVVAVTVTGGSAADTLKAGVGADAKADVLNGGAGADILYAGSNGAKLTGGDGNDLFIVTSANGLNGGNKEGNTYSEITDFKSGDLLQLQAHVGGTGTGAAYTGGAVADVSTIGKLAATLNETTATFSNFVDAAIKEAGEGAAVWFNYKGDLYVVVDSGENTESFVNGSDLIVKLTGINGDNLTWNSDFGTAALI